MGAIETINAFTAALNGQQWDTVASLLTDDFTFSGATPQPLGKQEFIAGQKAWFVGVPDWHVSVENVHEEGGAVKSTSTITGTHSNTLALPGQPAFPATGKRFSSPNHTSAILRGGQLATLAVNPVGLGILEQLMG
jgi:predicted ester cyclase